MSPENDPHRMKRMARAKGVAFAKKLSSRSKKVPETLSSSSGSSSLVLLFGGAVVAVGEVAPGAVSFAESIPVTV